MGLSKESIHLMMEDFFIPVLMEYRRIHECFPTFKQCVKYFPENLTIEDGVHILSAISKAVEDWQGDNEVPF
ncbi:MAG TPA: hypothetical protein VMW92_02075 [Candidatus Heimdallarchaeota archaeon]|nr:hypothetical protein [Candidatus Heimdallarchaeota archaeon]